MNLIGVLLLLAISVLVMRELCRTWCTPAAINTLLCGFFSIGALTFYSESQYMNYRGVIYLLILTIVMCMGEYVGSKLRVPHVRIRMNLFESVFSTDVILIVLLLIGSVGQIGSVYANGYSILDFLSIDSFLAMNNAMALERYYGDGAYYSVLLQIVNCISYALPFIGGWLFANSKTNREKLLSIFTFVPIVIATLLTNGKIGIIATSIMWGIGWILSQVYWGKLNLKINVRLLLAMVFLGLLFFGFIIFVMMARIGRIDQETLLVVFDKFVEYGFGHIEAFDVWYAQDVDGIAIPSLDWGENTFMAICSLFTGKEKIAGVYGFIEGVSSNIFTAYRGLIMDFGVVGSCVFIFAVGMLSGILYGLVEKNNSPSILTVVMLAMVYFWVVYAAFISAWIYTSYMVAFVIIWLYLVMTGGARQHEL